MSSNNNIDKLFRDKLENREFELSEDSRRAAEAFIIAGGKKAVWFSSKLWLGLSVVAIIAVMLPFVIDNEQEELLTSTQDQEDIVSGQNGIIPEGSAVIPEGSAVIPEGSAVVPEGSAVIPEGSVVIPEGSVEIGRAHV